MNLKEVQSLIKSVANSGAVEFKLASEEVKIVVKANITESEVKIKRSPSEIDKIIKHVVTEKSVTHISDSIIKSEKDIEKSHIITSPFIGTFVTRPSSGKSEYVKIGDTIEQGETLCMIEALKLFNEVTSEVSGEVTEILVEDFSPVEFNQPLFVITR